MADWSGWKYEEWAEKAGVENLRARIATGDFLLTQANTLLTVLLVGIGASMASAVRIFEPGTVTATMAGSAACGLWLLWIAVLLAVRCIMTRETQMAFNEPQNIFKPELRLDPEIIVRHEIKNIQRRIDLAKQRNSVVAWWLDACRYATLATPVIFIAGAACAAGQ
jgi:hypothetical protein